MTDVEPKEYLLLKRGWYYGPDNRGYVGRASEAGRYLKSEESPECEVTAIHEKDAAEYAPGVSLHRLMEYRIEDLKALKAENERLRTALKPFTDIRDQSPEGIKLISKKFPGFSPVTITVTKDQWYEAINAVRGRS